MKPAQRSTCAELTRRMDNIRLRAYVEKISGISAADSEAFLHACHAYEQGHRFFEDASQQEVQNSEANPQYHWTFTDFDKYTAERQQ